MFSLKPKREREKELVFVVFWKEREWVNATFDHCMSSSTCDKGQLASMRKGRKSTSRPLAD